MNFEMRRMCQLTVVVALCAPALLADTFGSGANRYGEKTAHRGSSRATLNRVGDVRPFVDEFQATSDQGKLAYTEQGKDSGSKKKVVDRVVKFDTVHQNQQVYMTALFLAAQMIGVDRSTAFGKQQTGVVNNALWTLFAPPVHNPQVFKKDTSDKLLWGKAQPSKAYNGANPYPNTNIWTPKPPRGSVHVPEPSLVSLLAFNALVLGIVGYCLRRRGVGFVN